MNTSKTKDKYQIAIVPGDGIGKEVMDATLFVLDSLGIDFDYVSPRPADPAPDIMQTSLKEVLDEIFAVDPISGFPKGDIQYYLSSEGNPQVKQWLENNLLKPRLSGGSSLEDITEYLLSENH